MPQTMRVHGTREHLTIAIIAALALTGLFLMVLMWEVSSYAPDREDLERLDGIVMRLDNIGGITGDKRKVTLMILNQKRHFTWIGADRKGQRFRVMIEERMGQGATLELWYKPASGFSRFSGAHRLFSAWDGKEELLDHESALEHERELRAAELPLLWGTIAVLIGLAVALRFNVKASAEERPEQAEIEIFNPVTARGGGRKEPRGAVEVRGTFHDIIEDCRRILGSAPRSFARFQQGFLQLVPPGWAIAEQDEALEVYERQEDLLCEGDLVWGALVQANSTLFRTGGADASPALVVYSPDPDFDQRVEDLQAVASAVDALRETHHRDPQLENLGKIVRSETARAMQRVVPAKLTKGELVYTTTVMVHRKHVPGGLLGMKVFPLLIHPETRAAMILPRIFWPESLQNDWRGDLPPDPPPQDEPPRELPPMRVETIAALDPNQRRPKGVASPRDQRGAPALDPHRRPPTLPPPASAQDEEA